MSGPQEFDWFPDWVPEARRPTAETIPGSYRAVFSRLIDPPQISSTNTTQTTPNTEETSKEINDGFARREKVVVVIPNNERTVARKLGGLQLAMITVNATLGTGLYWRGGQILELGGPLAVLLSYLLPGFLAWAVMQCITEMLCIWPIPGALAVYVSEFVDVELGIAVGVAYWFTYSVSFAAIIATLAAEIHFWGQGQDKGIDAGVVYVLVPVILVVINSFRVEIYGWIEVIGSSIKLVFLLIVVSTLIAINVGVGRKDGAIGVQYWQSPTDYDKTVAPNWITSLFMCLSIATFAYVGVEIVSASALEARWPDKQGQRIPTGLSTRSDQQLLIGKTVKFSAVYMPVIFTLAYVLTGLLVTFNISRDDPRLPHLSWISVDQGSESEGKQRNSVSVFVSIAQETSIPYLDDVFNVFLIFTALTCCNTNLYVASRTLFGLTSGLDGGSGQPKLLRMLAWFGRTNRRKVPMRALIFSALAFCWVPFLQLQGGNGIDIFVDILATMGSVGVIIVWACECWAFIRFYHCIYRHRAALQAQRIAQVRRWDQEDYNDYPYRSHLQPFLAYVALAGCLFILTVVDGAKQWNGFQVSPFLSSYLIILVFLALWAVLKIVRRANWVLVDLHNEARVINKIRKLHDIRLGAS